MSGVLLNGKIALFFQWTRGGPKFNIESRRLDRFKSIEIRLKVYRKARTLMSCSRFNNYRPCRCTVSTRCLAHVVGAAGSSNCGSCLRPMTPQAIRFPEPSDAWMTSALPRTDSLSLAPRSRFSNNPSYVVNSASSERN